MRVPRGQLAQAEQRRQRPRAPSPRPRGEDRVGELRVDGLSLGVQRLEAVPVLGQRPLAALDPPPRLLGGDLEPDDDVAAERFADPLRAHRPAAERDHAAVGVLEQLAHLGGLEASELLLAATPEEPRDRHPELALEQLVGLDRLQAGGARGVGGGRLAGAHEADEDDRRPAGRRRASACVVPL